MDQQDLKVHLSLVVLTALMRPEILVNQLAPDFRWLQANLAALLGLRYLVGLLGQPVRYCLVFLVCHQFQVSLKVLVLQQVLWVLMAPADLEGLNHLVGHLFLWALVVRLDQLVQLSLESLYLQSHPYHPEAQLVPVVHLDLVIRVIPKVLVILLVQQLQPDLKDQLVLKAPVVLEHQVVPAARLVLCSH